MQTIEGWEVESRKFLKAILSKLEEETSSLRKNLEERVGLKLSEMSAVNEERQGDQNLRANRLEEELKRLNDVVMKL